jgi:hypothetical protein
MEIINNQDIIMYGLKQNFYLYDGELYTATFPYEWAKNHFPGTGPKNCESCIQYGNWNGVFIAYCRNCAKYVYKGERGGGVVYYAGEGECASLDDPKSAGNTYLKNLRLTKRLSNPISYTICGHITVFQVCHFKKDLPKSSAGNE